MAQGQEPAYEMKSEPAGGGGLRVEISGRLEMNALEGALERFGRLLEESRPHRVELAVGGIDYLDSGGALALCLMEEAARKAGADFRLAQAGPEVRGMLALVDLDKIRRRPLRAEERGLGFVEQVGQASLELWRDFVELVTFLGDFLIALSRALRRPRLVRWQETFFYMEQVGVNGLPIVGLISFLLGLIIAFMSSLQLKTFGADAYVAALVSVAMVRELGPIMTAILVAGRSGSSFAAEIGTMRVNEEVDALEVMGFDPTDFLAIPKMLAALAVVPVLTIYSCVAGILGGMVVGIWGLGLTPYTYLHHTIDSLSAYGITTALIKSLAFALIIAGIGCQRGFVVRGGAQAVGSATTSAVVTAMFLIIVADSAFAVLFYYVF